MEWYILHLVLRSLIGSGFLLFCSGLCSFAVAVA